MFKLTLPSMVGQTQAANAIVHLLDKDTPRLPVDGNLRRSASPHIRERAKTLRGIPQIGEVALWKKLRAKRLGFRFHHQMIVCGWIAEFWCLAKRLVVEIDRRLDPEELRSTVEDSMREEVLREKRGILILWIPLSVILDDLVGALK